MELKSNHSLSQRGIIIIVSSALSNCEDVIELWLWQHDMESTQIMMYRRLHSTPCHISRTQIAHGRLQQGGESAE